MPKCCRLCAGAVLAVVMASSVAAQAPPSAASWPQWGVGRSSLLYADGKMIVLDEDGTSCSAASRRQA